MSQSPMRAFYFDAARGHIEAARETLRDPDPELRGRLKRWTSSDGLLPSEMHEHCSDNHHRAHPHQESRHHYSPAYASPNRSRAFLQRPAPAGEGGFDALEIYLHRHPAVLSELRRRTLDASPRRFRDGAASHQQQQELQPFSAPAAAGDAAGSSSLEVPAVETESRSFAHLRRRVTNFPAASDGKRETFQEHDGKETGAPHLRRDAFGRRLAPTPTPLETKLMLQHLPNVYPRILAVSRLQRGAASARAENNSDDDKYVDDSHHEANGFALSSAFNRQRRSARSRSATMAAPTSSRRRQQQRREQIIRTYSAPVAPSRTKPRRNHRDVAVDEINCFAAADQEEVGAGERTAVSRLDSSRLTLFQRVVKRSMIVDKLAQAARRRQALQEQRRSGFGGIEARTETTSFAAASVAASTSATATAETVNTAAAPDDAHHHHDHHQTASSSSTSAKFLGGIGGVTSLRGKLMTARHGAQRALAARYEAEAAAEAERLMEEEAASMRAHGLKPIPRACDFSLGKYSHIASSLGNNIVNTSTGNNNNNSFAVNRQSSQQQQQYQNHHYLSHQHPEDFKPVSSVRHERQHKHSLSENFKHLSVVSPRVQERLVTALRPLPDASFEMIYRCPSPVLIVQQCEIQVASTEQKTSEGEPLPIVAGMRPLPPRPYASIKSRA